MNLQFTKHQLPVYVNLRADEQKKGKSYGFFVQ